MEWRLALPDPSGTSYLRYCRGLDILSDDRSMPSPAAAKPKSERLAQQSHQKIHLKIQEHREEPADVGS